MKDWATRNLSRVSLTQLLLLVIALSFIGCVILAVYIFRLHGSGTIYTFFHAPLVIAMRPYSSTIFLSVLSGIVGAQSRIYMVEMRVAREPKFHDLDKELQTKIFAEYEFYRHLYLLGIVASFVSIVTIGVDMNPMHKIVLGILSSMAGSQFLAQRVEGGPESSPQFPILQMKLDQLTRLQLQSRGSSVQSEIAPTKETSNM